MSNLKNKVQLIGNLGADPEIKVFDNTKLARFSVATNENYKDRNGEWQKETTWHNVTCWGPIADRAEQFLKKGSFVLIEGKLVNRDYTDDKGEKRYITEVRVRNFLMLDKRDADSDFTNSSNASSTSTNATTNNNVVNETEDDLPF